MILGITFGNLYENMKLLTQRVICTSMFIEALFTIVKIKKQPVSTNRPLCTETILPE